MCKHRNIISFKVFYSNGSLSELFVYGAGVSSVEAYTAGCPSTVRECLSKPTLWAVCPSTVRVSKAFVCANIEI